MQKNIAKKVFEIVYEEGDVIVSRNRSDDNKNEWADLKVHSEELKETMLETHPKFPRTANSRSTTQIGKIEIDWVATSSNIICVYGVRRYYEKIKKIVELLKQRIPEDNQLRHTFSTIVVENINKIDPTQESGE